MKTKLLKLALCAMALMPMGTWADDVVVNTTKTWDGSNYNAAQQFEVVTADIASSTSTGLYYRAGAKDGDKPGRSVRLVAVNSSSSYVFSDNTTLSTSSGKYYISLPRNTGINLPNTLIASTDLGSAATDASNRTVSFTTGVAGTVYVFFQGAAFADGDPAGQTLSYTVWFKGSSDSSYGSAAEFTAKKGETNDGYDDSSRRGHISFHASEGGTFVIGSKEAAMNIYVIKFIPDSEFFGTEGYVNTAKTWTFGAGKTWNSALETGTNLQLVDGLYFRGLNTTYSKYGLKDISVDANKSGTFGDGTTWTGLQYASIPQENNMTGGQSSRRTAGTNANINRCFAFNVTVPGTCYVVFSAANTNLEYRLYFNYYNKSTVSHTSALSASTSGTLTELKLEANDKGTFWFGGNGGDLQIYAIRFVPNNASVMINANGYATFSSPNAVDFTNVTNAKAYIISEIEGNKAQMQQVTGAVPAETGLVMVANPIGSTTYVSIPIISSADALGSSNLMIANTSATILANNDGAGNYNYTLAYAEGPVFKHSSGTGYLAAGKAFLRTTVNVGDASRSINLVFGEDETTGISTVKVQNEEVTNGEYYDLMGRRIANPTKGLYIVNGKKVFIK